MKQNKKQQNYLDIIPMDIWALVLKQRLDNSNGTEKLDTCAIFDKIFKKRITPLTDMYREKIVQVKPGMLIETVCPVEIYQVDSIVSKKIDYAPDHWEHSVKCHLMEETDNGFQKVTHRITRNGTFNSGLGKGTSTYKRANYMYLETKAEGTLAYKKMRPIRNRYSSDWRFKPYKVTSKVSSN